MEIRINLPTNDDNYIYNLAFVKALMIKKTIENLDVTYEEKEKIKKEILKYLS